MAFVVPIIMTIIMIALQIYIYVHVQIYKDTFQEPLSTRYASVLTALVLVGWALLLLSYARAWGG